MKTAVWDYLISIQLRITLKITSNATTAVKSRKSLFRVTDLKVLIETGSHDGDLLSPILNSIVVRSLNVVSYATADVQSYTVRGMSCKT